MKFSPKIVRFFFLAFWFFFVLVLSYRLIVLGCILFLDPYYSSYYSSFLLCAFSGLALDYSLPSVDLPSSPESSSSSPVDGELLKEEELPKVEEPAKPKAKAPMTTYDYL